MSSERRWLAAVALAAIPFLGSCGDSGSPAGPEGLAAARGGPPAGNSRHIVVFKEGTGDVPGLARRLTGTAGGTLHFTYQRTLKGFAASFPAAALEGLRHNPHIAYIEPDAEVQLFDTQNNPPSWGLDRIDQADTPLSGSYTWPNSGAGVNVYILDTGVRLTHNDFGGRAQYVPNGSGGNFVGDGQSNAADCHGHGTHVAGTAAGNAYGVAKGASIWAARVVNCQGGGNVSMAIAAVEWVTDHGIRPAVVNMSLGYGNVQSLRTAVENSVAAGVVYAVAAGNGNFSGQPVDACAESPAGAPNALTVGATASNDAEASFSNYGTCVDILAPGVSITSAYHSSNSATATMSGTSMATPHVAGAAALYLAANQGATPAQVMNALKTNAIAGTISLHRRSRQNGTPNRLLNVTFIGGGSGPSNTPPDADFSFSCSQLSCSFTDESSDSDGNVVARSWNFGDGATSSAANPSRTYAAPGTYTVTLTVTDDDDAQDTASQPVTVSTSGGGGITLSGSGFKVKGVKHANLTWQGASGASVDLYRNGSRITTTANDGSHTDNTGQKGGGSFVYRICEAGTSTCSNDETVTF